MNCKPGDLARFIRSDSGNVGRMVSVIRLISADEANAIWESSKWTSCDTQIWLCHPLQPIRRANCVGKLLELAMRPVPVDDNYLRPIRGDGLTDDAPTEIDKPHPVDA